jgi:hypothetical protein
MENPTEHRQIVYNAVICLNCNETLISRHRHDCQICNCANRTFVDGGMSYLHHGGKDLELVKAVTVYDDEPFEKVRQYATRGSRGKDGKEPLTWVKLCDMSDDHLGAVLVFGGAPWHLKLITKELQYRREHGISITET